MTTLQDFLDTVEYQGTSLFAKRLAANDTLATGAHQAGAYVPKQVAFSVFPSLKRDSEVNPRIPFDTEIISHRENPIAVNIIWYNNKTRDECHITRWGGAKSPLLDPDATGSVCLFGFFGPRGSDATYCRVWLCSSPDEEDKFEQRFDVVDPGRYLFFEFTVRSQPIRQEEFKYDVSTEKIELWAGPTTEGEFPTGKELIKLIVRGYPETASLPVDQRLLRRRDLEYVEFRHLEKAIVLPRVRDGFDGVDQFVDYANSVTNRRKARSGRSLELQMVQVFQEEGVSKFAHDQVTEGNKRPDFVFPSIDAYRNPAFPAKRLRMLACKTTCKDRWRQVIDEAPRINPKHLLTLQQGVSQNQHSQMQKAGIQLVVPAGLHKSYPKSVRTHLETVESFIAQLK